MAKYNYNYNGKRKFNIPPIAFVIFSVVVIIGCIIGICSVYSMYYEDESFKSAAGTADAVCTDKTVFVDGSNYALINHYVMVVQFYTEDDENGELYQVTLDESNVYFKNIEVGDTIQLYYDKGEPTICHPTILYGDPTPYYVIFGIIILAAFILAVINLNTLIRNINGYTPQYTKPEDIGYMGDGSATGGPGDSSIDYNSANAFDDKLMDSYVDPFAAYSGYGDGEAESFETEQGGYYDPNLKYDNNEDLSTESNIPHDVDINNPFVTNVNSDPNNPYNTKSCINSGESGEPDINEPFTIDGGSSFGATAPKENEEN